MFAFLRCGGGFERIVMPNYYPTTKRMAANSSGNVTGRFGVLQQIATVCEQSATVFTREMSLQQFVNRVQQIATSAVAKIAIRQPQTR
jgi:hypothetical protein